jgi:glucose/arabinose dehydrogenase/mono/diheme cytochrome c family protein
MFSIMKLYVTYTWAVILVFCFSECNRRENIPTGDADNGGLYLPSNFEAVVVVDSIGPARHIAVNDNGDIYVKLTYNKTMQGRGGTVALRDVNNDGRADSIVYFGGYKDEGTGAVGVTIHNGYLYTSTGKNIFRNKLSPGDLLPESETEIVLTDKDTNVINNWHTTKPVAFDNNGYMYVPFGSPSDAGQDIVKYGPAGIPGGKGLDPSPELVKHGGIWKFPADKMGLTQDDGKKIATGIRSVVGMQWNTSDGHLYAVVNGMDNLNTLYPKIISPWEAAVLPAETLIRVTEGSDFGWPYAYYDQLQGKNILQPGYGGDGKTEGRAKSFDTPVTAFPGHWAPMDILFYNGKQFPERYKKGAFVAFHGSVNRSPYPQAGYVVCFVPFIKDADNKTCEVFADGFTGVDTVINTTDALYRPMGLATGPDGSIYIVESNQGKIWRIMYKGDKNAFGETHLKKMEARESMSYIKTPDKNKDNLQTAGEYEGSILYDTYCSSCHQRNGQGDKNRFPPLAESEWVKGPNEKLIKIILTGIQGEIKVNGNTFNGIMPHFNHLDDQSIASILTYVRRNFNNNSSAVSVSEVTKARKTVIEKR